MKEQGFYQKDVVGGPSDVYYSDGTIRRKMYYSGGELNGCDVFYDEKGRISDKYCYDNGVLEEYFSYDTTSNVLDYIVLKDGTAEFQLKHLNGNKSANVAYKYGELHGVFEWYDGMNQLETRGQYEFGNKVGQWDYFDEEGNQSFGGKYLLNEREGEWKWYFEGGSVETVGVYESGKKTGKWLDYHENGNLNLEEHFIEDVLHGTTTYFDETGAIQILFNYYEGTLVSYTYLNAEGVQLPEIPLKNESGKVIAYYRNGNKSIEYELEKGFREGEFKIYHSNGNLLRALNFKNGQLKGKAEYFTVEGIKRKVSEYKNGDKSGVMTTYYPSGTVKSTQNYLLGELYGKSVWYSAEGTKVKERVYYNDEIISEQKF
jgi:antitoxin component YwqK of YwqJK toxin-antitoxin module